MIGYFNKKGALIKRTEWNKRVRAKSYRMYRHYENGDIQVIAEWHGVGDRNAMPENRKIFRIVVSNLIGTKWVKDISLSEEFATEQDMLESYEGILLEHTDSFLNDDFEFEEVGNVAPPIPVAKKKEPKPVPAADTTLEEIGKYVESEMAKVESEEEEEVPIGIGAPATSSGHLGEWS